jgi:2'-5' RNA ligase
MRLFVAFDIDAEIRRRIEDFRDQVRQYAPDVRWVSSGTFHITLQFLGESEKREAIHAALQLVRGAPISIAFRGTGFFPNAKAPRVFWVGIDADQSLQLLVTGIASALKPLGFKQETSPYTPHLTLARAGSGRPRPVRGESSAPSLRVVAIKLEDQPPPQFGSMTACEFFLYESKLSPSGARYTRLNRYPLE